MILYNFLIIEDLVFFLIYFYNIINKNILFKKIIKLNKNKILLLFYNI